MKQLFLKTAKALGLFALARMATRDKLRILCYHGIWLADPPVYGAYLFMTAETFARRMQLLSRLGYPVLPLEEGVRRLKAGGLSGAPVAITIDDGWYSTYSHMLPALESQGFPATIYVTTHYALKERPVLNIMLGWCLERAGRGPYPLEDFLPGQGGDETVDLGNARQRERLLMRLYERLDAMGDVEERWAEVQRLARLVKFDLTAAQRGRWFDLMRAEEIRATHGRGFDIQLHTHRHRQHGFDPARVIAEIEENRRHLSGILGVAPASLTRFCYPSGNWSEVLFPALRDAGITQATTTEFGLNGRDAEPYALSRILDGESLTDLDFEARLSGFWSLVENVKAMAARRKSRPKESMT